MSPARSERRAQSQSRDAVMATEKQIKANRENAKRSTGPKSLAGRMKSSQNARRHGLSLPLSDDPLAMAQAYKLYEALASEDASDLQNLAALEMAQAHTQLSRVAAVRRNLIADLDLQSPSLEQVRHLVALERYELRASRQRRRAAQQLLGERSTGSGSD